MLARIEQVHTRGGKRPVVVFTAAVDAYEGLFVKKADKSVLLRYLFHDFHRQLIVVNGDVGRGEDGHKLVLGGGGFVVLGLGKNSKTPKRFV